MKKLFTLLATVTLSVMLFAQAPQSFSYQTVIRDASWTVLDNQSVGIKISILEDVSNGTVVYEESHSATTSQIGLVNLSVGDGVVMTGLFNTIDWGNHNYFIEVAVDVTGGTSYIVMGTTQLRSVPYALYAENSGSSTPGPQGIQGVAGPQGLQGAIGNTIWQQDSLNNISYNLGKVGIGTSNPKENFQIGDRWFFFNGLTKAISYNQFWNGNNWEYETTNPSSGIEFNMGNTGAVSIYTSQSGTAGTQVSGLSQKLTVLNDGKVGIGTTTPSHTLEVISPSTNARTFKIRRNKNIPGYGVPIDFHLLNSLNQDVQYGMIAASIADSAAGAEIGFLSFQVANGSGSFSQSYQQERFRVGNDRVTVKNVMNLEPLSTTPINASKGDMYMNGTTNKLMVYDGTIWQACW